MSKFPERPSAFWPTVWLVVAFVVIKATYVKISDFWTWATPRDYVSWLFVRWVAAISFADVVLALALGLIAAILLRIVRKDSGSSRVIFALFLVFGFVSIVYAVVSRQIFAYYAAPLTYQLLTLGGEPSKMWSSLEPYLTTRFAFALFGAVVAYLLLSLTGQRLDGSRHPWVKRATRVSLAVSAVAWLILGRQFLETQPGWFEAQDRHIADSPQSTLLASALRASPNARASLTATEVRPEDVRELTGPQTRIAPVSFAKSGTRPKNVIVVVLESVGTRYLGIYGSKYDTTPRLRAEAANSVVFDRYYAPVAWTAYSLISLVLAQNPPMERYNMTTFRTRTANGESLPDVLRKSGYRTAFMAAGDPDWASAGFLEANGFQDVVRGGDLAGAKKISSWGTADRFLFDRMLQWIDEHSSEPLFLMAWTDQTHHPYTIGSDQKLIDVIRPANGKPKPLGRYLSLVRESDAQIGRLFDELRRRGIADSTLIVVTGDHGEAFGEPHGGNGHGFTVYDEEVRVPLLLWNPRLFRGGSRSPVIGAHPDLAPTVLDILGLPQPAGWDGRSLFDSDKPPRTYFFAAAWGEYLLGVRDQNVKYIYDAREGRQELFDLAADPDEQKNLAASDTARGRRLRERLAAWLQVERGRADSRNR